MSNVITFEGYRPSRRYDGLAWTSVRIEEATSAAGPWTTIDTIALSPLDSDPSHPALRNFTTENATLTEGFYRVTFLDADGDQQLTDPVEHSTSLAYFTIAEFRARYPDLSSTTYPDATVQEYRELAQQAFEDAAQCAFIPRSATDTLTLVDGWHLQTMRRPVRSVTQITDADGTDVDITNVDILDGGYLRSPWTGAEPFTVTYEHGLDAPPLRVKQAVMLLTHVWMVEGPVDKRATQIPVEGGGTLNLATPGMFGDLFGIPDVRAALQLYQRPIYLG